ncbi:hypothetical protein Ahy_A10g050450 isoform C [Arachis hypogaea]|uniref:Uncharacterized protein n=1 Tax=Arachis hypogaea TaxID=3818 RepID=A0A445B9G0_ARAHY|nr:hypothetical protein Ahy_A10g050450 isoform C [Arachis hypogaea]
MEKPESQGDVTLQQRQCGEKGSDEDRGGGDEEEDMIHEEETNEVVAKGVGKGCEMWKEGSDPQKGQNLKWASTDRSQNRHRKASETAAAGDSDADSCSRGGGNMNLQLSQYKRGSFPGHRQTGTKKSFRTFSYSTRSARDPQFMHLPTPDFSTCRTCRSNPPAKKKNIAWSSLFDSGRGACPIVVPANFFKARRLVSAAKS